MEGGQAGRIGGGLDPNAIQKGGIYWYRDAMDGVEKQVEVVAIDRSVQPPSIAIRVDGRERETEAHRLSLHQSSLQSLSGGQGSVHGLLCVAERRATRPNGEWGYSTRRHMLGPERPEAVSPGRGVLFTDFQSFIDCQ